MSALPSAVLLRVLRSPETMAALSADAWTDLIRAARASALLGKLAVLADDAGIRDGLPRAVRWAFEAADLACAENARMLRWEVNRLTHALRQTSITPVLLKGAAYVISGLQAGRGRMASDLDILVARGDLADVEKAVIAGGWQPELEDGYDERYYRDWMHELPPYRHEDRETLIDIHHTILPLTGRIRPDAAAMLADSATIEGHRARILSPEDMVVHAAVHLAQDGDLSNRLRDLVDLSQLVEEFRQSSGFWGRLADRTALHDARRPVFYALATAQRLLGLELPAGFLQETGRLTASLMATLIDRAIPPVLYEERSLGTRFARLALFIRSHWLRMPPFMLARHLLRKALRGGH
ncbi:MAG: nucleotidyltransferase family protein [Sphingomonadales bacterium]|nr:nucleotidyltransferase family protein [Sphingomonadales bacterium]